MQVTTQQLEYLVATSRADTWAEAAASLGVTPSALSQGLAELERRVGLELFERDGRRRVPTRDHAEVLRYAEAVVAATDDLARWARRRRDGRTGTIRLGMIDAAATHHFRDVLRDHRRAHPDLTLRLRVGPSGELLRRLASADLDLVVCVDPDGRSEGIEVRHLLDDPLAVLAPGEAEVGAPATWGPWVVFPEGSHTRAVIADALGRLGARIEVVAESHQPEVLREMVRLGVGWTVLPVAGLGPVGDLQVVRRRLLDRRLVLARRSGAPADAAVEDLAAALVAGV